jgi:hypothetical protein
MSGTRVAANGSANVTANFPVRCSGLLVSLQSRLLPDSAVVEVSAGIRDMRDIDGFCDATGGKVASGYCR